MARIGPSATLCSLNSPSFVAKRLHVVVYKCALLDRLGRGDRGSALQPKSRTDAAERPMSSSPQLSGLLRDSRRKAMCANGCLAQSPPTFHEIPEPEIGDLSRFHRKARFATG